MYNQHTRNLQLMIFLPIVCCCHEEDSVPYRSAEYFWGLHVKLSCMICKQRLTVVGNGAEGWWEMVCSSIYAHWLNVSSATAIMWIKSIQSYVCTTQYFVAIFSCVKPCHIISVIPLLRVHDNHCLYPKLVDKVAARRFSFASSVCR